MAGARHQQIVKQIEDSRNEEDLNACRASIRAFTIQRGGVSQVVNVEEDELNLLVAIKELEIQKQY